MSPRSCPEPVSLAWLGRIDKVKPAIATVLSMTIFSRVEPVICMEMSPPGTFIPLVEWIPDEQ
jgi:hypothetical protein